MIGYLVKDGQVVARHSTTIEGLERAATLAGAALVYPAPELEGNDTVDLREVYLKAGQVFKRPPRPSRTHRWDSTLYAWVDDLEKARELKNAEINAARLTANRSTFEFAGKPISCDELSRGDIDGVNGIVSLLGAMPPDWPGAWKAADNTYVPIPDVATWTAFYGAMVAQGTANFAHAQALKALLALATTAEEIDAITWETAT
jgi:hypothetical protein